MIDVCGNRGDFFQELCCKESISARNLGAKLFLIAKQSAFFRVCDDLLFDFVGEKKCVNLRRDWGVKTLNKERYVQRLNPTSAF